ncbi:hypothetical protein cyc_07631 [Cyclospora cayetanensis]|uniref:Polycystin cation channel PKD1/PKD2 domain-containing protein n=1 Tax=Cyclospora cayetanensis TaxID=88456 RepID=A0A1D3D347_9EIME|nr:hypothetical protein cyc_07631 [Cyclospora cayetanensis]
MLLLFLSYALEITKLYEATDGIVASLESAPAPTPSSFSALSVEIAEAEQLVPSLRTVSISLEPSSLLNLLTLTSKADVASWLLYGFIPLLFGPASKTSNLGLARVIGNCFRITFRQVELQDVDGFDLGYEGVWPLNKATAASSIAETKLRTSNPLTNPAGSRFTYSYPFAASGEGKAFNDQGGYYQVICADSAQAAQAALQQAQPHSRYPPWFVPMPVIADRRTISIVVDFFVVNPLTQTFSHCVVPFSFTSSGTLQRPLIRVLSLVSASSQANRVIRFTALGLVMLIMLVYLVCEYTQAKEQGLGVWLKRWWTALLLFHILLLLGLLSSFAAVQIIAQLAPQVSPTLGANGQFDLSGAPTASDEDGFYHLLSEYAYLFHANYCAQQSFVFFGSLAAVTGCMLIAMLLPSISAVGAKSLEMTFRKVKYNLLACSIGMLAIALLFVSLGNISFGAATEAFSGYYERQAIIEDLFPTRYEWLRHSVATSWTAVRKGLFSSWKGHKLSLLTETNRNGLEDDVEETKELKELQMKKKGSRRRIKRGIDYYRSKQQDEESQSSASEYYKTPTEYPSWVWQTMGIENPPKIRNNLHNVRNMYVDPASKGPCIVSTVNDYAQVYALAMHQNHSYHEGAWKKLLIVAFVAILVATASLQLSVDTMGDMGAMARAIVASTSFPVNPVTFTCADAFLGLQDVAASIYFPMQSVLEINTARDFYSWLVADQGLMAFLAPPIDSNLFLEIFPELLKPLGGLFVSHLIVDSDVSFAPRVQRGYAHPSVTFLWHMSADVPYQQLVISNWNSTVAARSVRVVLTLRSEVVYPTQLDFTCSSLQCEYQPLFEPSEFKGFLKKLTEENILRDVAQELAFHLILLNPNSGSIALELWIRFKRNRGGTITPTLSVHALDLHPYSIWDPTTIAAVALQVATAALLLFFGSSFFVDFQNLWKRLRKERQDFGFGSCLGVFFVDNLFNSFDLICFAILMCLIFVWIVYLFASPHSQVFDIAEDFTTAMTAAGTGGSYEEAASVASTLFRNFSSASELLQAYSQIAAVFLTLSFLRLLRIGHRSKRMTLMFFTLASAAGEMVQVLVGAALMYIGFSYLCFLSFGCRVEGFSSVKNSFVFTMWLTTGYFSLSELFQADAVMAGGFLFPYLFFMGIICFSCFVCVLLRSLACRSVEIKTLEKLGQIEETSILQSVLLFFHELICHFRSTKQELEGEAEKRRVERLKQKENGEAAFGKRTSSDQDRTVNEWRTLEKLERERRERPLKVLELPIDVITSSLSDEQYLGLPNEVRLFARHEVALFVDRFRLMATQLNLGCTDILPLVQQFENNAYTEMSSLSREVQQQEGRLQHELSVYTTKVVSGQERLETYIKFVEKALQEREEELKLEQQELELIESKWCFMASQENERTEPLSQPNDSPFEYQVTNLLSQHISGSFRESVLVRYVP